jgi:ribosomal protein S18 acetylase RimI-like enzyme
MREQIPSGWLLRPPTQEDKAAIVDLNMAREKAFKGEITSTRAEALADLETMWSEPGYNLEEQCRLLFDASGRLVCVANFVEYAHTRYSLRIISLPDHPEDLPRDYLMELGESWVRQDMRAHAPQDVRIYMQNWVPAKDENAHAWYRQHPEFPEVRRFWEMQINLDGRVIEPVWPQGVELRPFDIESHTRAVYEAEDIFFRDHWGYLAEDYREWRHWTVEQADFDPSLWFVAWAGEEVVGIALCEDAEVVAWVNTVGVARAWRGQGLGLALLHQSFGELTRRGRRRAALGVDSESLTGATRLYERAGMHVAHENILYEKELRAGVDLAV